MIHGLSVVSLYASKPADSSEHWEGIIANLLSLRHE